MPGQLQTNILYQGTNDHTIGWQNLNLLSHPNARQVRASSENLNFVTLAPQARLSGEILNFLMSR